MSRLTDSNPWGRETASRPSAPRGSTAAPVPAPATSSARHSTTTTSMRAVSGGATTAAVGAPVSYRPRHSQRTPTTTTHSGTAARSNNTYRYNDSSSYLTKKEIEEIDTEVARRAEQMIASHQYVEAAALTAYAQSIDDRVLPHQLETVVSYGKRNKRVYYVVHALHYLYPGLSKKDLKRLTVKCYSVLADKQLSDFASLLVGPFEEMPFVKDLPDDGVTLDEIIAAIVDELSRRRRNEMIPEDKVLASIASARGVASEELHKPFNNRAAVGQTMAVLCKITFTARRALESTAKEIVENKYDAMLKDLLNVQEREANELVKNATSSFSTVLTPKLVESIVRRFCLLESRDILDIVKQIMNRSNHVGTDEQGVWMQETTAYLEKSFNELSSKAKAKRLQSVISLAVVFVDLLFEALHSSGRENTADVAAAVGERPQNRIGYRRRESPEDFPTLLIKFCEGMDLKVGQTQYNNAEDFVRGDASMKAFLEEQESAREENRVGIPLHRLRRDFAEALQLFARDFMPLENITQLVTKKLLTSAGVPSWEALRTGYSSVEQLLDEQADLSVELRNTAARVLTADNDTLPTQIYLPTTVCTYIIQRFINVASQPADVDITSLATQLPKLSEQLQQRILSELSSITQCKETMSMADATILLDHAASRVAAAYKVEDLQWSADVIAHCETPLPSDEHSISEALGYSLSRVIDLIASLPTGSNIVADLSWDVLFFTQFGPADAFLRRRDVQSLLQSNGVRLLHCEDGSYIRIPASSSPEELTAAAAADNPASVALLATTFLVSRDYSGLRAALYRSICDATPKDVLLTQSHRLNLLLRIVHALPSAVLDNFLSHVFHGIVDELKIPVQMMTHAAMEDASGATRRLLVRAFGLAQSSNSTTSTSIISALLTSASPPKHSTPAVVLSMVGLSDAEGGGDTDVAGIADEGGEFAYKSSEEDDSEKDAAPAKKTAAPLQTMPAVSVHSSTSEDDCPDSLEDARSVVTSLCDERLRYKNTDWGKQGAESNRLFAADIYEKASHFVYEVIQNPDDTHYHNHETPAITFTFTPAAGDRCPKLTIHSNEIGFRRKDVRSVSSTGCSTKGGAGAQQIGRKGIGFKSVFAVSDIVEVHSGYLHFQFNLQEERKGGDGWFGPNLPRWMDGYAYEKGTTFVLHIINEDAARKVQDGLSAVLSQPSILLFLRKLQRIEINTNVCEGIRRESPKAFASLPDFNARLVTIFRYKSTSTQEQLEETSLPFFLADCRYSVSEFVDKLPDAEKSLRGKDKLTVLSIAYPLQRMLEECGEGRLERASLPEQPLYCFLPMSSAGLPFLLQADWTVTSNREKLHEDSVWNKRLATDLAPRLFSRCLDAFSDFILSSPSLREDRRPKFLSMCILMLLPRGSSSSLIADTVQAIQNQLQNRACILAEDGQLHALSDLISPPKNIPTESISATLQEMGISVGDRAALKQLLVHADISDMSNLQRLGVRSWDASAVTSMVESRLKAQPLEDKAHAARFLQNLGQLLDSCEAVKAGSVAKRLGALACIPLRNDVITSAAAGKVFYLPEGQPAKGLEQALDLWPDLRILDPSVAASLSKHSSLWRLFEISKLTLLDLMNEIILPLMEKVSQNPVKGTHENLVKAVQTAAVWFNADCTSSSLLPEVTKCLSRFKAALCLISAGNTWVKVKFDSSKGRSVPRVESTLRRSEGEVSEVFVENTTAYCASPKTATSATPWPSCWDTRVLAAADRFVMHPDYFTVSTCDQVRKMLYALGFSSYFVCVEDKLFTEGENKASLVPTKALQDNLARDELMAKEAVDIIKTLVWKFGQCETAAGDDVGAETQSSTKSVFFTALQQLITGLCELYFRRPFSLQMFQKELSSVSWLPALSSTAQTVLAKPSELYCPQSTSVSLGNWGRYCDIPNKNANFNPMFLVGMGCKEKPSNDDLVDLLRNLSVRDNNTVHVLCRAPTKSTSKLRPKGLDTRVTCQYEVELLQQIYEELSASNALFATLPFAEDEHNQSDPSQRYCKFVFLPTDNTPLKSRVGVWDDFVDGELRHVYVSSLCNTAAYSREASKSLKMLQDSHYVYAWKHAMKHLCGTNVDTAASEHDGDMAAAEASHARSNERMCELVKRIVPKLWNPLDNAEQRTTVLNAVMAGGLPFIAAQLYSATVSQFNSEQRIVNIPCHSDFGIPGEKGPNTWLLLADNEKRSAFAVEQSSKKTYRRAPCNVYVIYTHEEEMSGLKSVLGVLCGHCQNLRFACMSDSTKALQPLNTAADFTKFDRLKFALSYVVHTIQSDIRGSMDETKFSKEAEVVRPMLQRLYADVVVESAERPCAISVKVNPSDGRCDIHMYIDTEAIDGSSPWWETLLLDYFQKHTNFFDGDGEWNMVKNRINTALRKGSGIPATTELQWDAERGEPWFSDEFLPKSAAAPETAPTEKPLEDFDPDVDTFKRVEDSGELTEEMKELMEEGAELMELRLARRQAQQQLRESQALPPSEPSSSSAPRDPMSTIPHGDGAVRHQHSQHNGVADGTNTTMPPHTHPFDGHNTAAHVDGHTGGSPEIPPNAVAVVASAANEVHAGGEVAAGAVLISLAPPSSSSADVAAASAPFTAPQNAQVRQVVLEAVDDDDAKQLAADATTLLRDDFEEIESAITQRRSRVAERIAAQWCREMFPSALQIKWVNEDAEVRRPFDIEVCHAYNMAEFIEVKSTVVKDRKYFRVSPAELYAACSCPDRFSFILVHLLVEGEAVRVHMCYLNQPLIRGSAQFGIAPPVSTADVRSSSAVIREVHLEPSGELPR